MKKAYILSFILITSLALSACGKKEEAPANTSSASEETSSETSSEKPEVIYEEGSYSADVYEGRMVSVSGPYGEISVWLPIEYEADLIPMGSEEIIDGQYGIRIYKPDVDDRGFYVNYYKNFGVCGTDLVQEETTLGGVQANVGRYGGNKYWNFVTYLDDMEGVIALSCISDEHQEDFKNAMDILNTVSLNQDNKCGGVYYYTEESEALDIGVQMSVENITATGATVVFNQWNTEITGELSYGAYFDIEKQNPDTKEWEALAGQDMMFIDIAYLIPLGETSTSEINWEGAYGSLEPGTYRLHKTIVGPTADGKDTKSYDIYACFIWAGEDKSASSEKEEVVGLANPWMYYDTLAEASKASGLLISNPEALLDKYTASYYGVMSGTLLEANFVNPDNDEDTVCIRKQAGEEADISGVYEEYSKGICMDMDKGYFNLNGDEANIYLVTGAYDGTSYSIYAPYGLAEDTAEKIINELISDIPQVK